MFEKDEQDIMKSWVRNIDEPLVSIHCLAYNHELYISQALDSFLMQESDFGFEIVIGEDCSSDKTCQIIKEYQAKYPQLIKLITSDKNVGMQENYIRTMKACKGKYIAICDGDDYWSDKYKLQIQIDEMKKYPECELSFHIVSELYGKELKNSIGNHGETNKIFTTSEIILGDGNFCPSSSLIFTKNSFSYFPESFYKNAPFSDYFTQISGSLKAGALYIAKNMSIYRKAHEQSWSTKTYINLENQKESFDKTIKSFKELNELLKGNFAKALDQIMSKKYYFLSLSFLLNKDFKEFAKYIKKADELYKLTSLKAKILLFFGKNGFVLNLIQKYVA